MKNLCSLVTIFVATISISSFASAMEINLGQHVQVENSSAINSTPVMKNGTFLKLKGAELFGANQVILSFEMFYTEEDKKDLKGLKLDIQTYKVIVDQSDSLSDVEGLKLIQQ